MKKTVVKKAAVKKKTTVKKAPTKKKTATTKATKKPAKKKAAKKKAAMPANPSAARSAGRQITVRGEVIHNGPDAMFLIDGGGPIAVCPPQDPTDGPHWAIIKDGTGCAKIID